jgi:hypothetical protein
VALGCRGEDFGMNKASTAIKLALIGSAAVLMSYFTCRQYGNPSSQPSGRGVGHSWFGHGGWSGGSHSGGASAAHGVSARGGFGGSGHAAAGG